MLGATNGRIPEDESLEVMKQYLDQCKVPVEIYRYDPRARDDLYGRFRDALEGRSDDDISRESGLRRHSVARIREAVARQDINSLSRLAAVKGIGGRTLERSFSYLLAMKATPSEREPEDERASDLVARSHPDRQRHVDHIEQLGSPFLTRAAGHDPAGEKP